MFAAMAALLVVALCVPEAFGDRALAFAVAYGVVRVGHIALFVLASRDDPALRRSVRRAGGQHRDRRRPARRRVVPRRRSRKAVLWLLAIVVDWGGPALFGVGRLAARPGHFAERHNLIIILALGESIVALGVGAERRPERRRGRRRGPRRRARGRDLVDLLRRRRDRDRTAARSGRRRAASATRWPATPTPTCTSRWSPASC